MTRPPLIRTDIADLPPRSRVLLASGGHLHGRLLPRLTRDVDAFLITPYVCAILAVCATAPAGGSPIPFGLGQMSALISFICHVWWPLPSSETFLRTMLTQSAW